MLMVVFFFQKVLMKVFKPEAGPSIFLQMILPGYLDWAEEELSDYGAETQEQGQVLMSQLVF